MNGIKTSFLYWLAAGCVFCALSVNPALAQSPAQTDNNAIIQALLEEVRLLRRALQNTGLNAYRSQIIIERMRIVNEQVTRLTKMHADARNELNSVEGAIPMMDEQTKALESQLELESDPKKRSMLEFEVKQRKNNVEGMKLGVDRLREREQQFANQLRIEQAKLTELEGRFDALEREINDEIERQRAEEKPTTNKKQP